MTRIFVYFFVFITTITPLCLGHFMRNTIHCYNLNKFNASASALILRPIKSRKKKSGTKKFKIDFILQKEKVCLKLNFYTSVIIQYQSTNIRIKFSYTNSSSSNYYLMSKFKTLTPFLLKKIED